MWRGGAMDDVSTRAEFSRRVFELLGERTFRQRLEIKTDDGEYPIVTAMTDDVLEDIFHAVAAAGWKANVAVSLAEGFMVMAMDLRQVASKSDLIGTQNLDVKMPMRKFLAMVVANEGGRAYRFQIDGELGA